MDRELVAVCHEEGGLYHKPVEGQHAPIRFYSDGSIEDEYIPGLTHRRFTPQEVEQVRRAAEENDHGEVL